MCYPNRAELKRPYEEKDREKREDIASIIDSSPPVRASPAITSSTPRGEVSEGISTFLPELSEQREYAAIKRER